MSYKRRFVVALISTASSWLVIARDSSRWPEGKTRPAHWEGDETVLKDIPQFVIDYAPLVHLNSKEYFWPGDMSEHLEHVTPYVNETKVDRRPTVNDLEDLNDFDGAQGRWTYLESHDYIDMWTDDNVKDLPQWLTGTHNIPVPNTDNGGDVQSEDTAEADQQDLPDPFEDFDEWYSVGPKEWSPSEEYRPNPKERRSIPRIQRASPGGRSSAPVVLIVVEKGQGIIDAFWFYFYSYNLGNSVFTFRFGNHVGDWEHSVVRFKYGEPKALFLSEHEGGKGYTYHSVEKIGIRPVIYSASGTHAMYPTPGIQDYVLPFRILKDQTDRGPLWDPLLNLYSYHYNTTMADGHDQSIRRLPPDPQDSTLMPSTLTPDAPTSWFYYGGHWGDRYYDRSDHRQYQLGTEKAYVSGPWGPRFKALGRRTVCPRDSCYIKKSIAQPHWALRLFIDYLYAVAIIWLLAATILSSVWCAGCRRTRRVVKIEGDIEEPEVTEEDSLLAHTDLVRRL